MYRRKQRPRTAPRKPVDCTCNGDHTQAVDHRIDNTSLRLLIGLAACPAEKRALDRILWQRENNIGG